MSGLCGWGRNGGANPESTSIAGRMLAALRHRGPDAAGHASDDQVDVTLGNVWLHSFVPPGLAPAPALAESERTIVVVDGPVFTAGEGPSNPARAVLEAYERGDDVPLELDGPHTVALWDRRERKLLLARDPLGEKPLYYAHDAVRGTLVFGSEIKAILQHPDVSPEVDTEGLSLYMTFGWMPAPKTMFAGVEKLAPGELLEWRPGEPIRKRLYWSVPATTDGAGGYQDFVSRSRDIFMRALEKNVEGQDEVGVFLSGGMDSTILLIALKELGVRRIHSFTLGLPTDDNQERDLDIPYARLTAERFGTVHQELYVQTRIDPSALIPQIMSYYDDPVMTPNCFTKYLLAAMARRAGVPSVLTGSGAGGGCGPYRRFRDPRLREKLYKKIRGIDTDAERWLRLRGKVLTFDEQRALLPPGAALGKREVGAFLEPVLARIETDDYPRSYLLANLMITCPEKAVAVLDRSGLMASVDVRSPHLDRSLIEFQMGVPASFDGGCSFVGIKCLLADAYGRDIPAEVLDRRETGFPTYYWNGGELTEMHRELFTPAALAKVGLDPGAVHRILDEERRDTAKSAGKKAWVLTQICLWHAIHVRGERHWVPEGDAAIESFFAETVRV